MRTELVYTIQENDAGKSVASLMEEQGFSRRLIDDIKHREGGLTVDGEEVFARETVSAGQVLRVKLPPEHRDDWIIPQDLPLQIVYEDEDLLVVNKAAGQIVYPTKSHQEGTLANALAYYFAQKKEPFTFRVVNRLDQDTSGLLLIPCHAFSACVLGKEMAARQIRRVYLAAASGDLREVFPAGEGVIDAPLARVPGDGLRRRVDFETGEEARTHVKILWYNEDLDTTLCAATLESGRTHQIRVHFQYIGHPLPGDFLYNPDDRLIHRQALHSYQLTFRQPVTKEELSFQAPLPEDMRIFVPEGAESLLSDIRSASDFP